MDVLEILDLENFNQNGYPANIGRIFRDRKNPFDIVGSYRYYIALRCPKIFFISTYMSLCKCNYIAYLITYHFKNIQNYTMYILATTRHLSLL